MDENGYFECFWGLLFVFSVMDVLRENVLVVLVVEVVMDGICVLIVFFGFFKSDFIKVLEYFGVNDCFVSIVFFFCDGWN